MPLEDYGNWPDYEEALWAQFRRDFLLTHLQLDGLPIWFERSLAQNGKEKAFWHLTDSGSDIEADRVPDLRRCERLAWARYILEHAGTPHVLSSVEKTSKGLKRRLTLADYSYLVVLKRARTHFFLVTAYYLEYDHERRKLRNRHKWEPGSGN
jgi:hypothetical protein